MKFYTKSIDISNYYVTAKATLKVLF